jgi:hypothetical protein
MLLVTCSRPKTSRARPPYLALVTPSVSGRSLATPNPLFEELSKNALRKASAGHDGIEFSILLTSPVCIGGLSESFRKERLNDQVFLFRPSA